MLEAKPGCVQYLHQYYTLHGAEENRLALGVKIEKSNKTEKPVIGPAHFLEKHFENELLEEIPMSYSKFRQDFKKLTGLSPNQYYLNVRLNKAKELLAATSLNINEIAYHTGFDSIFYFSKLFKKKNGVSPKDYRKKVAWKFS